MDHNLHGCNVHDVNVHATRHAHVDVFFMMSIFMRHAIIDMLFMMPTVHATHIDHVIVLMVNGSFLFLTLSSWETFSSSFQSWFGPMTIVIIALGKHFDYTQIHSRHCCACWWLKQRDWVYTDWVIVFFFSALTFCPPLLAVTRKMRRSEGVLLETGLHVKGGSGVTMAETSQPYASHPIVWLQLRNGHVSGGTI